MEIQSKIGWLTLFRIKRKISEKDFARCAFGKELNDLLSSTNEIELILNPHQAMPAPKVYEEEYKLN